MGEPDRRIPAAAAAAGAAGRGGSREVEGLVGLGRRLAAATTPDGLRRALRRSLPGLAPADAPWVLMRSEQAWTAVAGGRREAPHRPHPGHEAAAERVLSLGPEALDRPRGVECGDHVCFPMRAGGSVVGVLGASRAAPAGRRSLLAAVAALAGLAVGHVRLLAESEAQAARDGLTGCRTRASGMRALAAALERARRVRRPLSLVMVDLDDFKSVNDRHGHLCGDAVLAAVGVRLRAVTRRDAPPCRFGGDEFLLALPDTARAGAVRLAETLRREIARISVPWQQATVSTAASIGVAAGAGGETDARTLIARADGALYRAKAAGRNRVCTEVLYSRRDHAVDLAARQRGD